MKKIKVGITEIRFYDRELILEIPYSIDEKTLEEAINYIEEINGNTKSSVKILTSKLWSKYQIKLVEAGELNKSDDISYEVNCYDYTN